MAENNVHETRFFPFLFPFFFLSPFYSLIFCLKKASSGSWMGDRCPASFRALIIYFTDRQPSVTVVGPLHICFVYFFFLLILIFF